MKPQPLPCTPAYDYEFHAPAVHPYPPHLWRLQLDPHLESARKSGVGSLCGNNQRVKAVGCFRGGALSLIKMRLCVRRRSAPTGSNLLAS